MQFPIYVIKYDTLTIWLGTQFAHPKIQIYLSSPQPPSLVCRERLEKLSALRKIKPVDMTTLSQQVTDCHLEDCYPGT